MVCGYTVVSPETTHSVEFQLHLLMLMRSQPAISQITLPWLACITDTATPEFHRRISYIIDCNGKTLQYAVMQYMFENGTDIPVITPLLVIPPFL